MFSRLHRLILLALLFWTPTVYAALTIEITDGIEGAMPMAVVPFGWEGPTPQGDATDMAAIVQADLARTGRFRLIPRDNHGEKPHKGADVNFTNWRVLGAESLVVGRVITQDPSRWVVQFQLFDVFKKGQLVGYSLPFRPQDARRVAHYISDLIFEKLTGIPGAFTTRISYITSAEANGKLEYRLEVADVDGFNPQTIVRSGEPLMSPSWSPDGRRMAYVSFEGGRPSVYVQELTTGKRSRVSSVKGVNGAPAFSPDGRSLALTLSRDGSPDIYIYNLSDGRLRRLTKHYGIDTEPAWTPDSQALFFTSDRGGKPQIYKILASGGRPERVTFEGRYNARATVSPDGQRIAMVHGDGKRFYIAVQELDGGRLQILSRTGIEESPSFAPNGTMVIYSTEERNQSTLEAVSVDGRVRQRLAVTRGNVREPAWSPADKR